MNTYEIRYKEVFLYTLITVGFIAGVINPSISIGLGYLALCFCIGCIVSGREELAFSIIIVCTTLSIEVGYFATGIRDGAIVYSFLLLPGLNTFGIFLVNLLLFVKLKKRVGDTDIENACGKSVTYLHKALGYAILVGYISLIVTYAFNDNNVMGAHWYHNMIMAESFRMLTLFLVAYNTIFVLTVFPEAHIKLSNTMLAMLVSMVPVGIIGLALGFKGYRAGMDNLSFLPLFAFFSFTLFAFPLYNRYRKCKNQLWLFALLLLAFLIYRASPLGGKWFLSAVVVQFAILYRTVSKDKFYTVLFVFIAFVTIFQFVDIDSIITSLFAGNEYMTLKLHEAIDLFSYTNSDSIANSDDSSSAFRIEELLNIALEYVNKPYYSVFGKGIIGTLTQHAGWLNWDGAGVFSEPQRLAGTYVRVHETVNIIFLKYGILGLVGLFLIIKSVLKSMKRSPWATVGLLWILFYVGVYQSMLFGLVALILSLKESYIYSSNE